MPWERPLSLDCNLAFRDALDPLIKQFCLLFHVFIRVYPSKVQEFSYRQPIKRGLSREGRADTTGGCG